MSPPAPAVIGMPSRNEKRAAVARSRPPKSAVVIVIPERDVPGTSASAWAQPITSPWPQPTRSSGSPAPRDGSAARRSATHSTTAHTAVDTAMTSVERSRVSMSLPKSTPASTPGTVATPSTSASRRESSPVSIAPSSRLK